MKFVRLLILLVCMAFSANALADLKTYDVDPRNGEEIYEALATIILAQRNGVAAGSISRLPTGQILIDTTPEMHEQIAAVLESVSRYRADAPPRVTLQYWVVLGSREQQGAADMPPILADVLSEIRQAHGPLSFSMVGNASLVSDSGKRVSTSGDLMVDQTANVQGDTLNADISIRFAMRFQRTVTRVNEDGTRAPIQVYDNEQQGMTINMSMQRGEFVVLGENRLRDEIAAVAGVDGTLFYIVHWPAN